MDESVVYVELSSLEAHQLGVAALVGAGMGRDEAKIVVDHLVDAMLCGYDFAGLSRIPAMVAHPGFKGPHPDMQVLRETPVSAMIDAGGRVGYWPVLEGAKLAAKKAKSSGIAVVGVHNAWFSGRCAYYLEHIARQGLVAIHTASSRDMVVPPGAKRPFLGTNPVAFGFPTLNEPVLVDLGTSSTMWGEVLLYSMLDQHFPPGIGVDREGNPTTSAREIEKGGIVPFAGHKGFGLSLAVQLLGLLAGSGFEKGAADGNGFLFIAIDPEILLPNQEFIKHSSTVISRIKALPRQEGVDEIRIPSERAFKERERRREQGLRLPLKVQETLLAMVKE